MRQVSLHPLFSRLGSALEPIEYHVDNAEPSLYRVNVVQKKKVLGVAIVRMVQTDRKEESQMFRSMKNLILKRTGFLTL